MDISRHVFDETSTDFDLVLVGGGLQNGLIALALRRRQPALRLCLIESGPALAGNHTWCFHASDAGPEDAELVAGLAEHNWQSYRVLFPRLERELATGYSMLSSERLAELVTKAFVGAPGSGIELNAHAVDICADRVVLADGRVLRARAVIDATGPERHELLSGKSGYQKFVGLEVRTHTAHGLTSPILMDARVEQQDGFRFLYVLPLAEDRLLLEDTCFSGSKELDYDLFCERIHAYAEEQGYAIDELVRAEKGVLPLPWAGSVPPHHADQPIRAGYGGGWFHPVTGYSFPIALRIASFIAKSSIDQLRAEGLTSLRSDQERQMKFAYRLNKMLFTWFAPQERYNVLERFYTLDEGIIRRFYALQLTGIDRARVLVGRPPRGMSYKAAFLGRNVS